MWLVPATYGLSGIVVLVNVSMNVLGKPQLALYINIIKVALFYFPFSYLGAQWYGLKGLFIGIALGNIITYFVARFALNRVLVKLKIQTI